MDETPAESPSTAPSSPPQLHDGALTRRALFGTVFGGVTVVAGLKNFETRFSPDADSDDGNDSKAHSQEPDASPEPSGSASPVASPLASPVASPLATPIGPEKVGNLLVRRGETFEYDSTPAESNTLTMLIVGDDEPINFSPASFRHDYQISASYLDPLLWIDDQTMEPKPWLAESWEWDESGKVVTFSLRRDVRWHNDSAFRARDVVFSFTVYRDDIDSNVRNIFNQMESIEALDNWTVQVRLLTPDGNWLYNAATQLIFHRAQYRDHWVSRPAGERTLADFSWQDSLPIGTGPWQMTETGDDGVAFSRYATYFAGQSHFSTLQLKVARSREEQLARWNDGEGDILGQLRAADLTEIQENLATLYVSNGATVMFAAFNFENTSRAFPGLLGDLRVRQALSLAVDRNQYTSDVFSGMVRSRNAGTVAQPWANDPEISTPDRDLESARRLLTEAGLTDLNNDGLLEDFNGETLTFSAIVREDADPGLIALLNGMTEDLRGIGANFALRVLNSEDFTTTWVQNRDYDLIAYSYPLFPGFTDFDLYGSNFDIRINPQGWNPGGYSNETVDDLLKRLLVTVDAELQQEILFELQSAVDQDLFGLWFGFPDDLVAARDSLQGYQPNKYLTTWNTRLLWTISE